MNKINLTLKTTIEADGQNDVTTFNYIGEYDIKNGKDYNKNTYVARTGDDEAVILYSGGTTGTPKGVKLTNLNLNASAMQNFEHVACLRAKDKVLAIMPIFHGFGLSVCIHCVQYFGGESILLPQFNAKTFDKIIKKYEPNVLVGVPTLFEAITKILLSVTVLDFTFVIAVSIVASGAENSVPLLESLPFAETYATSPQRAVKVAPPAGTANI